jgi:transposase, IS605 OrfB family, central region
VVDDLLHKISREIVNRAKEENAVIVLGDLKGIRKQNRGRKFNRKLNTFPYYRLSKFIEYKASWEGIAVIKVSEANTSRICSRCGSQGLRRNGKFVCSKCGVELNADYNGALNILKRALGYMSKAGADLTQPRTPCDVPEQMKEVPDALGLRRENLSASAVESVNAASVGVSIELFPILQPTIWHPAF